MPLSVAAQLVYLGVDAHGTEQYQLQVRVDGRTAVVGPTTLHTLLAQEQAGFFEEAGPGLKMNAKRRRKAATLQERHDAESLGGQRQSGSGSRLGHKGDGRVIGRFRLESKGTEKESYRVERSELNKIRAEATGLEIPVFSVRFLEKGTLRPVDRWGLLPWRDLVRFAPELEGEE